MKKHTKRCEKTGKKYYVVCGSHIYIFISAIKDFMFLCIMLVKEKSSLLYLQGSDANV